MTLLHGRGIAAVNYPTGMNLGGDPTQALVHATTVGNFIITLSSVDLGQGLKTVLAQIGAEALGVPFETVRVDTGDTDTGPHCMGTFASRATHRRATRSCGPRTRLARRCWRSPPRRWRRLPTISRPTAKAACG